MAFTFQALNEDNTINNAEISLTLTPTTPLFTESNWVGGSTSSQVINVENDNTDVPINYFVSVDWYTAAGDSIQNARLLAEKLEVTVTADPTGTVDELFSGKLADLVQQPPAGRSLAAGANEDVEIEITLSSADATDLIQGVGIEFDLVFIAVSS